MRHLGDELALSEGSANFISAMLFHEVDETDPVQLKIGHPNKKRYPDGSRPDPDGIGNMSNAIESNSDVYEYIDDQGTKNKCDIEYGPGNELRVSRFLWDLVDLHDDGESSKIPFDELWRALKDTHPKSIRGVYQILKAKKFNAESIDAAWKLNFKNRTRDVYLKAVLTFGVSEPVIKMCRSGDQWLLISETGGKYSLSVLDGILPDGTPSHLSSSSKIIVKSDPEKAMTTWFSTRDKSLEIVLSELQTKQPGTLLRYGVSIPLQCQGNTSQWTTSPYP